MDVAFLRTQISRLVAERDFRATSDCLEEIIFGLPREEFLPLVVEIGIIPEDIPYDSSEEKLYAKSADIVLAKAFQELGLRSSVNRERANCADVVARSDAYGYSLVGDAKAFRLSRTAKNQKDFKVKSMVDWRGDHDYAVLVCPYYQYPRSASQIFAQAIDGNVLLFSWEHLSLLIEEGIEEGELIDLGKIWGLSRKIARRVLADEREKSFMDLQDELISKALEIGQQRIGQVFARYRDIVSRRGDQGILYWENRIKDIRGMSREEAVAGLISALKLEEKIMSIRQFISHLESNE